MGALRPFHLAFPVHDLEAALEFYVDKIGCATGRRSDTWIDLDLLGHQIVAHLDSNGACGGIENAVDGDRVPVPHFGIILTMAQWQDLRDRLKADATIDWVIEPRVRFKGKPGEQATMFLRDPSGNALEFKAFADDAQIFATG